MEQIPDFAFDALAEIIAETLGRDNMLYAAAMARDPVAYNAALEPVARADPDGATRFLTELRNERRGLAVFMSIIGGGPEPVANDNTPEPFTPSWPTLHTPLDGTPLGPVKEPSE